MKIVYIAILISFAAVAIFGFSGFSVEHNNAFMQCLKSIGENCAPATSSMGVQHADIYNSFSQAIASLFFLIVIMFGWLFSIESRFAVQFAEIKKYIFKYILYYIHTFAFQIVSWLSLFEKNTHPASV